MTLHKLESHPVHPDNPAVSARTTEAKNTSESKSCMHSSSQPNGTEGPEGVC